MKQTVPTAIALRAVPAELPVIASWANQEIAPVLTQARDALNAITRERVDFTSTGTGSLDAIWASDVMPTDGTWTVTVQLGAAGDDFASAGIVTTVRSAAGLLSLISTTTLWAHMGAGTSTSVTVDMAERVVLLNFDDGGVADLKVVAVIDTLEAVIE